MVFKDKKKEREYQKEYHKKNKDKLSKQSKEYRKRPEVRKRDKIYHRNYMKKYYQKPERKEYMEVWNKENKNKIKEYSKKYEKKLEVKAKRKKYRQIPKVKFKMKEISKKWYKKNRKKRREYFQRPEIKTKQSEYQKNNRDKINAHYRQRKKNDKNYSIKERVRLSFLRSLKKYSITGKIMSTSKYLNMEAIIKKLTPFPDLSLYEVDHIIPLKIFNHNNYEQVRKAWLPSNLQWLPKEINRWKSDRLIMPLTEEQKEKLLKRLQGK